MLRIAEAIIFAIEMISSKTKLSQNDNIQKLFIFQMELFVQSYRKLAIGTLKTHNAGIDLDEWVVLKRISEDKGCSQTELSEFTVMEPAKMTRTLDKLSDKSLIEKHLSPEDRRKYMVFTTKKAQLLIDRLMPFVSENREKALQGFSKDERKVLQKMLQRMIENVR